MTQSTHPQTSKSRTVIIVAIAGLLVIVAALLLGMMSAKNSADKQASNSKNSGDSSATMVPVGDMADDAGFVISAKGVGAADRGKPVSEIYLDFTCPGCMGLEVQIGEQLQAAALKGGFQLVLHPIATHNLPFNSRAAALLIAVYQNEPDKFGETMKTLAAFSYDAIEKGANEDGSFGTTPPLDENADQSIQKLIESLNLNEETVKAYSVSDAEKYLQEWNQVWSKRPFFSGSSPQIVRDGRDVNEVGTINDYNQLLEYLTASN
ncbi:MAG: thioredoxin domain-containing protein [Varibaculum sp.]|nr:thioredoxin domain-containing protein [Varibaculum sp.]